MIPIFFFQGGQTYISIESYSTALEVKEEILKKLRIDKEKWPHFQIYQVIEKEECNQERFVENDEKIMDIYSIWEREKVRN